MDKYYVYAMVNPDKRIYVGLSKYPESRVRDHNSGDTKSTKGYRPWSLFYKKFVGSRINARIEEKRLKSGSGKELLKQMLAKK